MKNEYIVNNDGTRQHRNVVEDYLGRCLTLEEIVHHLNSKKSDNRVVNLVVFETNSDHMRFHKHARSGLRGITAYNRDKDKDRFLRILYANYGITFYGPLYESEIRRNTLNMAERMKHELGLCKKAL